MSVREVTMYRAVCDWPGCEVSAQDDGEYYAWGEEKQAREEAIDRDWREGRDDDSSIYCEGHPTVWASDHEDGEPFPEPPYLLIHDGDTGNEDDDGKVSLIGGTPS